MTRATMGAELDRLLDAYLDTPVAMAATEGQLLDAVRAFADHWWVLCGSRSGMAAGRIACVRRVVSCGLPRDEAVDLIDAVWADLRAALGGRNAA